MSDRPPSRDLKTTSREIGPRANPGTARPEPNRPMPEPRSRGARRQENTLLKGTEVRGVLDPGEAAPHTARRTHNCVRRCPGVVASCSVTSPVITRPPGRTRRSRSSHASRDGPS